MRSASVNDPIGRSLIFIFLVKPIVDLFPQAAIWVGPVRLAPTTIFGVLMFFWFARYLLGRGRHVPPVGRLFEAFLLVNAISLLLGVVLGAKLPLALTVATTFKILDAYVVFSVAYLAAQRYGYKDITPFMTAIVAGSAVVVFLNVAAIRLGLTGILSQNASLDVYSGGRERGLYFDPGVLANVAFFSLVFTVFRFHLARTGRALWLAFTIVVVLADLYLIMSSKSRVVTIELAIFGLIYLSLYQQAWGRLAAPVIVGAVVLLASVMFSSSTEEMFSRFETDVAAVEEGGNEEVGVTQSGRISLGKYEGLGSNRGMLWAVALTDIFDRSLLEIVIGHFSYSVGAHSDYIDVLARNGVVGLALYVSLLLSLARKTFANTRTARPGHDRVLHFLAFTLVLCFILYALPFRPLEATTTAWYMWTLLAFSLAWGRRREKSVRARPSTTPASAEANAESEEGTEPAGLVPETWRRSGGRPGA